MLRYTRAAVFGSLFPVRRSLFFQVGMDGGGDIKGLFVGLSCDNYGPLYSRTPRYCLRCCPGWLSAHLSKKWLEEGFSDKASSWVQQRHHGNASPPGNSELCSCRGSSRAGAGGANRGQRSKRVLAVCFGRAGQRYRPRRKGARTRAPQVRLSPRTPRMKSGTTQRAMPEKSQVKFPLRLP